MSLFQNFVLEIMRCLSFEHQQFEAEKLSFIMWQLITADR